MLLFWSSLNSTNESLGMAGLTFFFDNNLEYFVFISAIPHVEAKISLKIFKYRIENSIDR